MLFYSLQVHNRYPICATCEQRPELGHIAVNAFITDFHHPYGSRLCLDTCKVPSRCFLWQCYVSWDNPPWESQQCERLLMVCDVKSVWAVHCCFDKLLMTCAVWRTAACKTAEREEKSDEEEEKRRWKSEGHLSVFLYHAYKRFQGGEGMRWRWPLWCHQPVCSLTSWHKHTLPLFCASPLTQLSNVWCNLLWCEAFPICRTAHPDKSQQGIYMRLNSVVHRSQKKQITTPSLTSDRRARMLQTFITITTFTCTMYF